HAPPRDELQGVLREGAAAARLSHRPHAAHFPARPRRPVRRVLSARHAAGAHGGDGARIHGRQAVKLFLAVLLLAAVEAMAQTYPAKPVRIIVAVGPGGGDDFTARQVAAKLSEVLGVQFIVENRPGAGGMIGQTFVARSAPDGYTLLRAGGSMAGARYVNANMGYDLARDFTPISLLETSPFALVVNAAFPARTVNEFIAHARANPGKLTFGTLGAGQIPHWSVTLF